MPQKARHLVWVLLAATMAYGCRSEPANPEEIFAARTLGVRHLERGELREAEEQFRKIVDLAPNDPFGYANLGLTYMQAGRHA
ncbi:MAG TPA: hypothetical protein VFZ21_19220, partial [Gemmatimonadaceae bacterium]|nr:hypothetical protein [Gemmatimonadaceae bacterium]